MLSSIVFNRLTLDKVMLPGESMKITHVAGNGFGLEFVRLDVGAEYYNPPGGAVPEPAAALLLLLGCAGLLGMRRRRRASPRKWLPPWRLAGGAKFWQPGPRPLSTALSTASVAATPAA